MEFDRWSSPGYVINHLSRLMYQALAQEIKSYDIVPGQFPVLLCLWEEDGLNQRQLYERVRIEQATMSNTLARMVRDDLIERRPDAEDRRATRFYLTGRGKKLEKPLTSSAQAVNGEALSGVTKPEIDTFQREQKAMISNLEEAAWLK